MAEKPDWKEMLSDIVKSRNLNPWDIDIEVITNEFIRTVGEMKRLNLRVSANVILAASLLLRYKCDCWTIREQPVVEQAILIPDEIISEPVFPQLEPTVRTTTRKVTLEELISAVGEMMQREKRKASRVPVPHVVPEQLLQMVNVTGKDFETLLDDTMERVRGKADQESLVLFSDLLDEKSVKCIVNNLVPLLHLANTRRLALWQEQYFGEIFIHVLNGDKDTFVAPQMKEEEDARPRPARRRKPAVAAA
jgi:segregation and condensation protein A